MNKSFYTEKSYKMTSKCGLCKETINRDKIICYGICDRHFHTKCLDLNTAAIKAISENETIKFVCRECDTKSNKLLLRKINQLLECFKSNDDVDGVTSKSIIAKIADDVVDIKSVVTHSENDIKEIKINAKLNVKSVKESYADKLKIKSNEPVVLVVPKAKQNSNITKAAIKEKIDPTSILVENIRSAAKGTIVLEGKTAEDVQRIKECAKEKMGEKYDIKVTELIKPKVVVSGMESSLEKEEIIKCLRKQNTYLEDAYLEVISVYSYGVRNRQKFAAIIEIDGENFIKVMEEGRVNIDWDRCYVKEHFYLRRCFKCNGFNHRAQECLRKKSCKKCAGEHDIKECRSDNNKCINCISANNKLKLNLNINHMASSIECIVYQRKLENERKKVNYNTEK